MRRFPGLTQTVRNWAHGAKEWAADTWTGVTHTAEDISHKLGDTLEGMAHSFEDSVAVGVEAVAECFADGSSKIVG